MPKALIDTFTKEELAEKVKEANSIRDLVLKLGYKTDGGDSYKTVKNRIEQYGFDISHFYTQERINRTPENIFVENSTANQSVLRRWYEKGHYTEYKCAICGMPPEWNGRPLTLTLDHINGKHRDDRLENLRWICPNCDRQLPTYSKGAEKTNMNVRNKIQHMTAIEAMIEETKPTNTCQKCEKPISKNAVLCSDCYHTSTRVVERPSREELKLLIRTQSFEALGRQFGVDGNAIRKWCNAYGLPRRKSDIKQYTDEQWEKI